MSKRRQVTHLQYQVLIYVTRIVTMFVNDVCNAQLVTHLYDLVRDQRLGC